MAQGRYDHIESSRRMCLNAEVSGFIVDIDSSLPDYVFSLVDVYLQGKSRVTRLTANLPRMASTSGTTNQSAQPGAIPTSNVLVSLSFRSGEVRLYSASVLGTSKSSSLSLFLYEGSHLTSSGPELFKLPEVTVWGEYRASSPGEASSGIDIPTLAFKSTIHSSQNTLRPTLLPFLSEFNDRLETRLRKDNWRDPPMESLRERASSETFNEEARDQKAIPTTAVAVSFGLRIDRSKLELTCLPDVNVIAGLNWESGGFVVNVTPGARQVAFTGNVGGLTVGLKHGFLSEDCIQLHARNLAFSTTWARSDDTGNSLSLVVDTEFSGSARLSRLQDMLCFKAVWLDRIPTFGTQGHNAPMTPFKSTVNLPSSAPSAAERSPFTTVILVRVRRTKLAVDLGHSISNIDLDLTDTSFRTRLTDTVAEISLHVAMVSVNSSGNISGAASVPDFIFQTMRRRESPGATKFDNGNRMLELVLTSGPLNLSLESEHQKLLQYR
jgi:hypothetical protein